MVAPGHARQPRPDHARARVRPGRPGRLAVGVALALGLTGAAACGGDDDEDATTGTTTTSTSPADTTTGGDGTGATPEPGTAAPADGSLPGEPIDIYPYADTPLGVVGVAADDTLNVRSGPGTDFDVVVELDPLADDLVATGTNRQLEDRSVWAELTVGAETGWANTAFLATPGAVNDVTSELDELPAAETLVEIADRVVELRAPFEPVPEVTVVAGPTVGDLGEITVDALGYGDDALAGERLHVFATPNPDGESFTTRTVEATYLCARGVTPEGICV